MGNPVTANRMLPGGDEWVIGATGKLTFESGASVEGLVASATFASNAEALTGTNTTKVLSPARLAYVLDAILGVQDASFVIGAEAAHKINVAIQLKDYSGDDMAERGSVMVYLADAATGEAATENVPDSIAIGTDGGIVLPTDTVLWLTSEADGDIDLDIVSTAAATYYLVVVLPNGTHAVSGAITFAGS